MTTPSGSRKDDDAFLQHQRDRLEAARQHDEEAAKPRLLTPSESLPVVAEPPHSIDVRAVEWEEWRKRWDAVHPYRPGEGDSFDAGYRAGVEREKAAALSRIKELEADLAEQCRLLGMGSEREARLMAERDAALRRAEEVEKDAARWRILRRGQHWSIVNGIGDDLRADALDAAVDAAIGKESKDHG